MCSTHHVVRPPTRAAQLNRGALGSGMALRSHFALSVAFAALCSGPSQAHSLHSSDLLVMGIRAGTDAARVRELLGAPDSVVQADDPSQSEAVPTWCYSDLRVALDADSVLGVWLTGASRRTARGLHVGASTRVARQLYGSPTNAQGDSIMVYTGPDHAFLFVFNRSGKVRAIYVGRTLD